MSIELKEILIGKGLGEIKFGMTRVDIIKLLGEPDEIEKDDEDEENLTEIFHYDELELSASFYEEEGWKLVSIAVSSNEFSFNGEPIIGLDKDTVITKVKDFWKEELEVEELVPESLENQLLVGIDALSLNLWFEDNLLTEIQWGTLWKDDETPIYS